MKKKLTLLMLAALLMCGTSVLASCGDNDDNEMMSIMLDKHTAQSRAIDMMAELMKMEIAPSTGYKEASE